MDYTVDYAILGDAGRRAADITEDVTNTLRDVHLNEVPSGIPNSMSASAADTATRQWADTGQELSSTLAKYSKQLSETAQAYRNCEQKAEAAIKKFFGGLN